MSGHFRFFAPASKGTEGLLIAELRGLGLRRVKGRRGGVYFEGRIEAGLRALLWSRIAQRVLLELSAGPGADRDALYELAREIPWEEHLGARHTFAVQATGQTPALNHTRFVSQVVKDAIVDRLRDQGEGRPSVDLKRPRLSVMVHVSPEQATLSLDLAGAPLYQRGWRQARGDAPMKETLAAAILAWASPDAQGPIVDPMCGSGTLLIEAACRARQLAPGLGRRFAFERWPMLEEHARVLWRELQAEAKDLALPRAEIPIIGRDHNPESIEGALHNAQLAGVVGDLELEVQDARDLGPIPPGAMIVSNPPYGERLGRNRLQVEGFFRQLGEAWTDLEPRPPLVLLTGGRGFERSFGAKAGRRHTLFNGPLECQLLEISGAAGDAPPHP